MNTQLKEHFARPTIKNYSATYDYLVSEVRTALPDTAKILTRRKYSLIAWRLGEECFYFRLKVYNSIIYRLKVEEPSYNEDLPKTFWQGKGNEYPQSKHRSELSFHFTEVPAVKGAELTQFVQDCFRCEDGQEIYRWLLFSEMDRWGYDYAWTVLGWNKETEREHARHKEPDSACPLCQPQPLVTT